MRRRNEQTLGEAIREMIQTFGLEQKLAETKLLASWEKTMGKTIAKHTTRIYINKKKLYVHLNSSVLREEMSYAKEKIVKMMNEAAGSEVIEEVALL